MAAEWYYTTNKQQMGPVSWMDLRELADTGILKPHDLVWTEGMDEWVKAVQQRGLFAEGGASGRASAIKPPPGRRGRRRADDEIEEEDEDDERTTRKKAKKRKVEREKMNTGLKVGLILGGVLCGLLFLGCAGGFMIWLAVRGNPRPAPEDLPIAMPFPQPKGGPIIPGPQPKGGPNIPAKPAQTHTYTVNNLMPHRGDMPNLDHRKQFNFRQGQRVIITVTNTLENPNVDVDLYVNPTNNLAQFVAADVLTPNINRNCRVEFIVPVTQSYTVRLTNLGDLNGNGIATVCQVTVEEY